MVNIEPLPKCLLVQTWSISLSSTRLSILSLHQLVKLFRLLIGPDARSKSWNGGELNYSVEEHLGMYGGARSRGEKLESSKDKLQKRPPQHHKKWNIQENYWLLQGYNWAHRDLKPQNIFVVQAAPQWWIKIGEIIISKRIREQSGLQTKVRTPGYVAPEIFPFLFADNNEDDDKVLQYTVAVDRMCFGPSSYSAVPVCLSENFGAILPVERKVSDRCSSWTWSRGRWYRYPSRDDESLPSEPDYCIWRVVSSMDLSSKVEYNYFQSP